MSYNNKPEVVYFTTGDVTGDGIIDIVYLTGVKTTESPFIQKIALVIEDGKTGTRTTIQLESDTGYNPTLFLGDFTGDRVKDILISIASGGSGGMTYYYIFSDLNNIPLKLFDYNTFNSSVEYSVIYKDFYVVQVTNQASKERFLIDISNKGQEYLSEIYDDNGKLRSPITGFVNPISGLYPVDFDQNGVFELLTYQGIAGRYNADRLGYVQTSLSWNMSQFAPYFQYVAVPGFVQ